MRLSRDGVNTTGRTSPGSSSNRGSGRSRESSRPRSPASTGVSGSWSTGPGRTDAGVHASGQVIAFTYAGRGRRRGLQRAVNALLPQDVAIRDLRRAPDGFHPTLCGAVPGVPLHRLERAAQSASRAPCALAAGPAGHRRHGERRVGLPGPARLLAPSAARRTGRRSGPCTWSGSGRRDAW